MIRVVESNRMVIQKYRLSLLKGDSMFPDILAAFGLIPFEAKIIHMYIVHTVGDRVNSDLEHMCVAFHDERTRTRHPFV